MADNDERVLNYAILTPEELINYTKYERLEEMANDKKGKLIKWLKFGVNCITIIAKVVEEIIQLIPNKEQN